MMQHLFSDNYKGEQIFICLKLGKIFFHVIYNKIKKQKSTDL